MDTADHKSTFFPKHNRRSFLKQSGQLLIGFSLFPLASCSRSSNGDQTKVEDSAPEVLSEEPGIDSWIQINADGSVTVLTGKIEIGQGIQIALMQIAAEELDVDLERVSIILSDTGRTPDERYTAGSASIESSGTAIRHAAAEARKQLLLLAEERLEVPPTQLLVEDGTVLVASNRNKSITYWEILNGQQLKGKVDGSAPLKDPADYKLVGTPRPRTDIVAMATGGDVYVQDMRLPDMVHGRILRPPSYGARLVSLPNEKVKALPGVLQVVRDGSFVGIIASGEYQAIKALNMLRQETRWEGGKSLPDQAELFNIIGQQEEGEVVKDSAELEEKLQEAESMVEASYTKPYLMHGSIGPSCAIARWQDEQLTVWTHSQGVFPLRAALAEMLDMPEENIRAIGVPGSGCYGHNGADDVAADAALLARAYPGRPVKVQWMREDEHSWEPYGSAMLLRLKGGLDSGGKIVAWQTDLWSDSHSTRPGGRAGNLLPARQLEDPHSPPSGGWSGGNHRNSQPLYELPALRVVSHSFDGPLRTSALRSLGAYANIFALESFMDELAFKAKQNPVEFRLRHLTDERGREVIRKVAGMAKWGEHNPEAGHGWGFAFARYKNQAAYFAVAAEVGFDQEAQELRVLRLLGAIDAGQTINPDGLKNQTEGGMIQSASWTMLEQVTFDRSHVTSRSWENYPIFRFPQVPQLEVEVVDRAGLPPLGAGEAAQGPTAAAIANAVFQATGKRVRDLPITPEKIKS